MKLTKDKITIIEENGTKRVIKEINFKDLLGGISITLKNKTTVTKKSAALRQAEALEGIFDLMKKNSGDKE
jgi:hypothetical protein